MTADDLPGDVRAALARVARVPRLLVASDYDGTLAPIVDRPDDAHPLTESVTALQELAALPSTTAALISGRARSDLAQLSRAPAGVHLVGSHGSEFDSGFSQPIDDEARARLNKLRAALSDIAAEHAGVSIEAKPASIALHVRNAAPGDAQTALEEARSAAAPLAAHTTEGKAVVEFAVISTDKGQALDVLRQRERASATVFIGDDVTDEKGFRRLNGADVGIKVGPGETLAGYRVSSPHDVAAALEFLLAQRRSWLAGHRRPC